MRRRGRQGLQGIAAAVLAVPCFVVAGLPPPAGAVEVRDLVDVQGIRAHHLIGYGLIVGLQGTGDSSEATATAVRRVLAAGGMRLSQEQLVVRDAALVMITAELPPFASPGQRLDVYVSAIGDAESLVGGRVISTPLYAGRPENVFARAQGPVSFGGQQQPQTPTSAWLRRGAIVERGEPLSFVESDTITLLLRRADIVQAQAIAEAISQGQGSSANASAGKGKDSQPAAAKAIDGGKVVVRLPAAFRGKPVAFLSEVLRYSVDVAPPARIVIHQQSGMVAISGAVRVQPCAFAHGDLVLRVGPARGATRRVAGPGSRVTAVESELTVQELVAQLNRIGTGPRDLIAIIQGLIKLGAINAELVIE